MNHVVRIGDPQVESMGRCVLCDHMGLYYRERGCFTFDRSEAKVFETGMDARQAATEAALTSAFAIPL